MTRTPSQRLQRLALLCTAATVLACSSGPVLDDARAAARPAAADAAARERLAPTVRRDLRVVRTATARYRDPSRAVLDGYRLFPGRGCVSGKAGLMGFHFVNVSNLLDGRQDLERPDYLLYAPITGGGFELAGVEWEEPYRGQPAPEMFGRRFDGPMAGHVPGQPVHYDIHVWVHRGNPSGTFARYNPAMTCCPPEHHPVPPRERTGRPPDPKAPFLGVGTLGPRAPAVRPGGVVRWNLAWTHPDDWRNLSQLTVRLHAAGREVARVAFDQETAALRATGAVRIARGSGTATADPSGRRVTVRLALRFRRALARRRLVADIVARDDLGATQRFGRVAVVRVRARAGGKP